MGRLLIRFFWDVYDYIGRLLLLNILSVMLSILIVPIPGVIAGLLYVMHIISSNREPSFADFFTAGLRYYWRSLLLCLIYFLGILILIINIQFYINPRVIPPDLRIFTGIIAGIFFWLFVLFMASAFFTFPLLVKSNLAVTTALKRGIILMLANPGLTLASVVLALILSVGTLISVVGLFLLLFVFLAALANATYDTAMERLEKLIHQKSLSQSGEQKPPSSWHEIKKRQQQAEAEQHKYDRYKRTLRDILKPWEYKD
ncbi:MAG: hypothetical protein N2246_02945 [Candidatus Sumerlaeia bacterium]|nr:hypothetical protein [Candidatus Sumerlaeia bacterium]